MVALPKWLRFGRRGRESAQTWSVMTDPSAWWPQSFAAPVRTASGEPVGEATAMGLSAYFASLRNGAQDLAKLPRKVRRERPEGERGSEILPRHPVARVLRQPNPIQTWGVFAQVLQHRAMGWGNGYAEIERSALGDPVALWPLHPSRVTPAMKRGVLRYEYRDDDGRVYPLDARDVFHVRGMGDGITGYSVLRFAAETLGLGLAAQRHAAAFFGEGMAKRVIAIAKGPTLSAEGREGLRKRILGDREQNPVGSRKLPIIDMDVDLKDMGIPPDEAQFLEQREFGVEEVARWFRMSLAKLQYFKRAQGWGTLDALNTDYATDFLQPWVTTWEEECRGKLFREDEQDDHFVKFNLNALMRGDSTSRVSYYASGLQNGWLSPNDVRELEDMDPIEDEAADQYRTQMQMVPLSMPEDEKPGSSDPMPPIPPPMSPQDPPDDGPEDESAPEEDATETSSSAVTVTAPLVVVGTQTAATFDPAAAVRAAGLATLTAMEATALRLVRVAANATARALAKHAASAKGYADWASSWCEKHGDEVAGAFAAYGTTLEGMAEQVGARGVGGAQAIRRVASEYARGMATAEAARKWVEGSPADAAKALAHSMLEVLTSEVTRA